MHSTLTEYCCPQILSLLFLDFACVTQGSKRLDHPHKKSTYAKWITNEQLNQLTE